MKEPAKMKKTPGEMIKFRKSVRPVQYVAAKANPGVRPEVKAALQESFVKFDALYRALAKSGG